MVAVKYLRETGSTVLLVPQATLSAASLLHNTLPHLLNVCGSYSLKNAQVLTIKREAYQ